MLIVAVALILCVILSGCRRIEVAERAFVEAVGLDRDGESLTVTFQILDSDKEAITPYVLAGKGTTFTEAFTDAEQGQVKKLFLGHCKVIVLGDGVSDVRTELEYFLNSNRISSGVKPVLADGKAESLVTGKWDFRKIIRQAEERGDIPETDLVRFFEQGDGVLLPIISEADGKISVQTCGLVTDGFRSQTLSVAETKGAAVLFGKLQYMPLAVNSSGAVTLTKVSASFLPKKIGDRAVLKVLIKADGIAEEGLHGVSTEEIEKEVGAELEKLCASALMKSSETETDFLFVKWRMKRSSPISERDFKDFLKNMEVVISVKSNIEPQRKF